MRRLVVLLSALSLAMPAANAVAALKQASAADRASARVLKVRKHVGPAVEADRWGPIKVVVLIRTIKRDGKLVSSRITRVITPVYPDSNPRSVQINEDALPYLIDYALQNQSAQIDGVTGATPTSDAFRESLGAALKRAGFKKV